MTNTIHRRSIICLVVIVIIFVAIFQQSNRDESENQTLGLLRIGMLLPDAIKVCRAHGLSPRRVVLSEGAESPVANVERFRIEQETCNDSLNILAYRCSPNEQFIVCDLYWEIDFAKNRVRRRMRPPLVTDDFIAMNVLDIKRRLAGKENSFEAAADDERFPE